MPPRWTPPASSLLSRALLLKRGVHPRRLASEEFVEPIPGYLTLASAPAPLHRVATVLQRELCPKALISHATAAELLDLPLPMNQRYAELSSIHVTIPPVMRQRLGPHVRVHRRRTTARVRSRGLFMPSPLDLLCGLAKTLSPLALIQVSDALVANSTDQPIITLATLRDQVDAATSYPGIKKVRVAVAASRERVESPKETELRLLLLEHGFAEPEINHPIRLSNGSDKPADFRLDLAYPHLRIAIEYDGDAHRTDQEQWAKDRRKDDMLHEAGWRVVRVTQRDLNKPDDLLTRLTALRVPRA